MKRTNRKLLPLVFVLSAGLCCTGLPLSAGPQKKKGKQQKAQQAAPTMEATILSLVNNYRKHRGKPPLTMHEDISKAAYVHSLNMARGKIPFGHADFDDRVGGLMKQLRATGGAENVAFSPKGVESVVHNWLNSDGHRENIEGNYNYAGVGIATAKNGYRYYTMIFLLKK